MFFVCPWLGFISFLSRVGLALNACEQKKETGTVKSMKKASCRGVVKGRGVLF